MNFTTLHYTQAEYANTNKQMTGSDVKQKLFYCFIIIIYYLKVYWYYAEEVKDCCQYWKILVKGITHNMEALNQI